MYYRFYPYTAKLCTLIAGYQPLESTAVQVETLCAMEHTERPKRLYLADDLEKIVAVQPGTTFENEMLRLKGGKAEHQATTRYTYKNVLAYPNGFSLFHHSYYRYGELNHNAMLTQNVKQLSTASFCLYPVSMMHFAHWVHEACPTSMLAKEGDAIILPSRPNWPHTRQYASLFEVGIEPGELFFVENFHAYEDYSQNSSKVARYKLMRQMIQDKITAQGNRFIYLARGRTGEKRDLANEAQLIEFLQTIGFVVVEPEKLTVQQIMEKCLNAEMVVSMEGSQLTHAAFSLKQNGVILALVPADRFINLYADYADSMELRYAMLLVEGSQAEGYVVNIDRLRSIIDMCMI